MVEVIKAEKNLYITIGFRAWLVDNSFDSSRIYINTSLINEKPKIFYFRLKKLTLFRVSIKFSPSETFNNEL